MSQKNAWQFKSTRAVAGCFLWQFPWLKTSIFQVREQSEILSSEFSRCHTRGQLFKIGANSVGPWLEGPTKGISFFPSRAEKASQVRWDSHLQVLYFRLCFWLCTACLSNVGALCSQLSPQLVGHGYTPRRSVSYQRIDFRISCKRTTRGSSMFVEIEYWSF